jgi:methyl-accepting chemotaxis protein
MRIGLAGKLIIAGGVTLVMALSAGFWVVLTREDRQARQDFKAELSTITGYAKAVQVFMAENPVVTQNDTTYYGLNHVPVVAAWLTAQSHAKKNDYIFRTPSLMPRSKKNAPTAFERRALLAFEQDPDLEEYTEEALVDSGRVLQYAVPLHLTPDCLACHGEPKGRKDPFGYATEGMKLGDLRGAFSLQAPLTALSTRQAKNRQAIFLTGLGIVLVTSGAVFVAIRVVTRPLDGFLAAIRRIGAGEIQERVSVYSDDEVGELAAELNHMADQLEASYATLEDRVQERTKALEQSQTLLVQASKLAALGELVGGIAHEVNTPIGIIIMRLASLRPDSTQKGLSKELLEDLDVIQRQANKVAQITSGLLAFARQTPFSPHQMQLNRVVENAVALVDNVMRNKGIQYHAH